MAEFYDISLDFCVNSDGDIKLAEDSSAIAQSIKNIMLTDLGGRQGSGFTNTVYGLGTRNFLFAPLTSFAAKTLGEDLSRQLEAYESRITVLEISVVADKTEKRFEIELSYAINKTDETFTFNTSINQI
jgi:phage baseplate assembly protein W